MSRRVQSFTQGEVTRAVKGVTKGGAKAIRVEIEIAPGKTKIIVFAGEAAAPASAPDTDHETSADIRELL
jgi:hypothetical protein